MIHAFSGRFLSAAGVIALSIILSRQLSLTEAGLFFEAFITLMGLAIALQFGMPLVILRKVARRQDDQAETDAILARALSSISALCGIVALGWIGFFFATGGFGTPLSWVWINILPTAAMGPVASYLKAKGYPGRGGFWEVGILSLIASGVVLVIPPTDAIVAWAIFSAACWIGMITAILHAGARHLHSFMRPALHIPLLLEGRFLWATTVLAYVSLWGGVLIAKWLLNPEATAVLNALFRTLTPLQFLILTIDFYMAPKFATASGSGLTPLYTRARASCLILALPYTVVLLALPSDVLSLLFGQDYKAFGTELRMIIAAMFLQISFGPGGILLNMHGQDRLMMNLVALKTTLYLSLSVVLGKSMGVAGITTALSISILVQVTLRYMIVRRKYLIG